MHLGDFALKRGDEQAHQDRDFLGRTAPVFRTERKKGEVFDAAFCAGFDDAAHRFHALGMARHARQEAFGGPASIAIHDDGNVTNWYAS